MPVLVAPEKEDEEKGEKKLLVAEKEGKKHGLALVFAFILLLLSILVISSAVVSKKKMKTKQSAVKEYPQEEEPPVYIPSQSRPFYHGSDVKAACAKNDDDERFIAICPEQDERAWCSQPDRTGPTTNFYKVCAQACENPDMAWAMPCAWQAIANLDKVCDGTFEARPPSASKNSPGNYEDPDFGRLSDGSFLYECDEHAVCSSCFGEDSHNEGEHCERIAAHYQGYGRIDSWYDKAFDSTGAEAAFLALRDLDAWCSSLREKKNKENEKNSVASSSLQPAWVQGYGRLSSGEYVQHSGFVGAELVEEHIITNTEHTFDTTSPAHSIYLYWRFVLAAKLSLDTTTHLHTSSQSLEDALDQHRIGAGALIFLDVREIQQSIPKITADCSYLYTDDLLLRSSTLRAALSYDRPLTLILAGDIACRLRLPVTHHQILFANDAGLVSSVEYYNSDLKAPAPKAKWFPSGLSGAHLLSDPQASSLDFAATAASLATPPVGFPLEEKSFFFTYTSNFQFSNNDFTKRAKGAGRLPLQPILDTAEFIMYTRSAVFTFISGPYTTNILEALILNSVPVVYSHERAGCQDPLAFWLEGNDEFQHSAPFIFVQDLKQIPTLLKPYAESPKKLDALFANLAGYRADLEEYLATLPLHLSRQIFSYANDADSISKCITAPLSKDRASALRDDAFAYYSNPSWLYHPDSFQSASLPGCSLPTNTPAAAALSTADKSSAVPVLLCFSGACAPPLVHNFSCSFVPREEPPVPTKLDFD